ncbi:MAG: hypothetical protein IJY33_02035 [Oscillospiraceae bacterium]|nr:hypothetical protein [Oscillospiraceae bacterium]MBQ8869737.1 hypothetical protein [Oscillospiraceae bacterium]
MKGHFLRKSLFLLVLIAVLFSVFAVGCWDYEFEPISSDEISSVDLFSTSSKTQTSSKSETSSKTETSSKAETSSKMTTSLNTATSSKSETSSEKINFYNSGVLPPDETSSEREIIFYNSGVYVEEESSEIVGRIAYDTPTGKKYHLDKECAGKNAIEVSYDEIVKIKEPCKTCAKDK